MGRRGGKLLLCSLGAAACAVVCSSRAETGFQPTTHSSEPDLSSIEGTFGWAFNRSPSLSLDRQIAITGVGIFDHGGDGLVNSHGIGIWDGFGTLLFSSTVPAGIDAPLVDGYRYISVDRVILSPTGGGIAGAHFLLNDADAQQRPNWGTFAPEILVPLGGYGLFSDGPALARPTKGISRGGMEGAPNYSFFPVNFQFEVVPEPRAGWLLAVGSMGWFLLRRAKRT